MLNRQVSALVMAFVLAASPAAQSARPDFSGVWQPDLDRSKALTEAKGHEWRVAGAGAAGSGSAAPAGSNRGPVTIITQSKDEMVLERRFEDEVIDRTVLKLDGSVSVNATRIRSNRSTTVWKGNSLVTTGTSLIDISDREITREFTTTRTLMPDGTMQVESRTTQDGEERVSWTVFVRVKSS